MNKTEKIQFVNEVYDRFDNARNHGRNGNNWWYPVSFRIAYNVKMRSFLDEERFRSFLTDRQKDLYSTDDLNNLYWELLNREAEYFIDEVKEFDLVDDVFGAGRRGGWLEVQYVCEFERVDNSLTLDEINPDYKSAKELDETEEKVAELISKDHKALNKYIESDECYKDLIINYLQDDDEIAEQYKGQIKRLTEKLK